MVDLSFVGLAEVWVMHMLNFEFFKVAIELFQVKGIGVDVSNEETMLPLGPLCSATWQTNCW